jgi:hypothetical protein
MPIGYLSALLAAKPKLAEVEYLICGKVSSGSGARPND